MAPSIVFGARLADVVSETPDGLTLDLRQFHELVPTPPAPGFPYQADLGREGVEGREGLGAAAAGGPAQEDRPGASAAPVRS